MIKTGNSIQRKALIVGGIILLILLIDQAFKIYVKSNYYPGQETPLLGKWFILEYTENPGMAFGTTFGNQAWHKLALSIFRVVAICLLVYYWFKQAKLKVPTEYLVALGFIIAGATGNLIDSMAYDFVFDYDPCMVYNLMEGSGIKTECGFWGEVETRPHGFLLGNVVDMFKFQGFWPQWVPFLGGKEIFPAIWNIADGAITVGVLMIFIRQKKYFKNSKA